MPPISSWSVRTSPSSNGSGCPPRPRIVALGGGTGLPTLLGGLKRAYFGAPTSTELDEELITAIVTIADDGGSSGRLRRHYQVPPPGDIRNCLLALADADPRVAAMFDFRFSGTADVGGHNLGNLILTALTQIENDFHAGLAYGASLLRVRGRVLPATCQSVTLLAEFVDGSTVNGESAIARDGKLIRRLRLDPASPSAPPGVIQAIEEADAVVIAPGSLYTSLIAVLLVPEIADALAHRARPAILVMNLMTEPGETDRYTAVDHILAIRRHAPKVNLSHVVLNAAPIPEPIVQAYAAAGSSVVAPDQTLLRALGYRLIERDLLANSDKVRHDADKLAAAVIDCALAGLSSS